MSTEPVVAKVNVVFAITCPDYLKILIHICSVSSIGDVNLVVISMKFFLKPRVAVLYVEVVFRYGRVLTIAITAIVPVTPDENITIISFITWD